MCVPALTIDEFFAHGHERERPIFEAVHDHLRSLGPVDVDPVSVGILFKNGPVFAELRPRKQWVAVTFTLPTALESERLSRKVSRVGGTGNRWYHVVNVHGASDIDDELVGWLTEAYHVAGM